MPITLEAGVASPVLFPAPKRELSEKGRFETAKGIPSTVAEYYGVSLNSEDNRDPFLYIFSEKDMPAIHAQNNGRYLESYRFNATNPVQIKKELLNKLEKLDIFLFFSEVSENLFRAILHDEPLQDIISVLGEMQKKYS